MGRKKMKQFSAPGLKISSIPSENPERFKGKEKAGGEEGQPGARDGGEGEREKILNGPTGDKRFEDEGGAGEQY